MVELEYIGKFQPSGMIVDVDEQTAKELILTKNYKRASHITNSINDDDELGFVSK